MTYKGSVQALCNELGIPNPIQEEDLTIASLSFLDYNRGPNNVKAFEVAGTKMNRAGRLFIQARAHGRRSLQLTADFKTTAAEFFTSELWDDCSECKCPLVYGIKTCSAVEIIRK